MLDTESGAFDRSVPWVLLILSVLIIFIIGADTDSINLVCLLSFIWACSVVALCKVLNNQDVISFFGVDHLVKQVVDSLSFVFDSLRCIKDVFYWLDFSRLRRLILLAHENR